MQKFIYILETDDGNGRRTEAYTTLTGALRAVKYLPLYQTARAIILKGKPFEINSCSIYKLKLNHQTYGKK